MIKFKNNETGFVEDIPVQKQNSIDAENFASKNYVDEQISDMATETYVDEQVADKLTQADIADLASTSYVDGKVAGLASEDYVDEAIAQASLGDKDVNLDDYVTNSSLETQLNTLQSSIPTTTSQLTNNSGFITSIPAEYVTETELNNKGYLTEQDISGKADKSELFSGSYNDLTNKPTIPDAYSHPASHPASMITGLHTVATSGSYNDLTNKPTIPSNISELANDSGFATETYVNNNITNLQERMDELFQNVNNGKELVASAIIDKGIDASGDETFQSLSHKISQIPVGAPGSNIIGYINEENEVYVSLTELEIGTYTLKFEDYDGLLTDFDDIGEVEVE